MQFSYGRTISDINNLFERVHFSGKRNFALVSFEVKVRHSNEIKQPVEIFTLNCQQIWNSNFPPYLYVYDINATVYHEKQFPYGKWGMLNIQRNELFFSGFYFPEDLEEKLQTEKYWSTLCFFSCRFIRFGDNSLMLPSLCKPEIQK